MHGLRLHHNCKIDTARFEEGKRPSQNALPILGDRIQLQQVILNLIVNGMGAMKDTLDKNRIISI